MDQLSCGVVEMLELGRTQPKGLADPFQGIWGQTKCSQEAELEQLLRYTIESSPW